MTAIKLKDETLSDVKSLALEKTWLQSGIDALKNTEENGYARSAEEMKDELDLLKETLRTLRNV